MKTLGLSFLLPTITEVGKNKDIFAPIRVSAVTMVFLVDRVRI